MEINYSAYLQKAYFFTAIAGMLMITCLFVYLVIVEYITRTFTPFTGFADVQEAHYVRIVLLTASAFLIVCIGIIKKRLLAMKPSPSSTYQAAPRFSFSIRHLVLASVLSYILSEVIALFGLTLFLIAGNTFNYYIFMALSLLSFIIHFPRYSQWETYMAEPSRQGYRPGS
jgi:hypothetical protein